MATKNTQNRPALYTVNLRPSEAQLAADLARARMLGAAGDSAGARAALAKHGLSYIAVEIGVATVRHRTEGK
jgi:hypothetical protein